MLTRWIVLLFVAVPISNAMADLCCPRNCVQDANHCVTTGPSPRGCSPVTCPPGWTGPRIGNTSDGTVSTGQQHEGGTVGCVDHHPTQAQITKETNRCVTALKGNAELVGCLFEDVAGKAEDMRTGMSCPARQAALARQCLARCNTYATIYTGAPRCLNSDESELQTASWKRAFGDIGGEAVGSASVEKCGPPLSSRVERQRTAPVTQPHQ